MTALFHTLVVLCLWQCLAFDKVHACEYNVRETGFADYAEEHYRLYVYVNHRTDAGMAHTLQQTLLAILEDCNVAAEIIDIDEHKDHAALKYVEETPNRSIPSAILVSPDSQVCVVEFERKTTETEEQMSFEKAIYNVVASPVRDTIVEQAVRTYGIILLINGGTPQESERAGQASRRAIENIGRRMKTMPKAIAHPPELTVLTRDSFQKERVLLWSLGLNGDTISKPYAAVIYGKARWIGPLLQDEQITEQNLTSILSIIGQDCECGLDMRVMLGTMLPVKWHEGTRARVVKHLGFDPENPLVRLRMNQILRKGSVNFAGVPIQQRASSTSTSFQDDPLFVDDSISFERRTIPYLVILATAVLAAGLIVVFKKKRTSDI